MSLQRVGDLQLRTDIRFHQQMWRVQHIAWYCALAILAAAVAGVFGSGPVSHRHAASLHGGLEVNYERFARKLAAADFGVNVAVPEGARDARIIVSHGTLDALKVEAVSPTPYETVDTSEGVVYAFRLRAPVTRLHVTFHTKLQASGPLTARFSLPGGERVSCRLFVYP